MEGGYADYALVEGEARRVAKEAVQALKESRRQCWQADAGVPSWTGQSGALRSPNISAAQVRWVQYWLVSHTTLFYTVL